MFRALGQTDPTQAPGIIAYVTLASADCARVLTDEIDIMKAHARSPNLTPQQSSDLLQIISDNYAKCSGATSGGGGPVITPGGPPIDQSTAPSDFFGGLGTIGIIAAIAVVGLLMMKR